MTTTADAPRRAEPRVRGLSRLVVLGAATCLASTVVGARNLLGLRDGGYVVLGYLPRPWLWLAAGLVLVAVGLLRRGGAAHLVRLTAAVILCLVAAGMVAVWGIVVALARGSGPITHVESPTGLGAVVVLEESDLIDTQHHLQIRHGSGLTQRWWGAGCVGGDVDGIEEIRWSSPTRVEVETTRDGTTHSIDIDPTTGRRLGPLPQALAAC